MSIHTMRIVTNAEITDEAVPHSRIIIAVNSCELDIFACKDGLVATLSKGNEVKAELPFDWVNAEQEPDPCAGL